MTASSPLGLLAQQMQPDSWTAPINGLIVSLALIISAIGVALIVWGAYSSVLRLIAAETGAVRGQAPRAEAAPGAMPFAAYLVSGLDFMIAGTVIKTLAVSDWQQAALLTGLVLVRTLLGLSMKWEAAAAGALATSSSVREHLTPPPRFTEVCTGLRTMLSPRIITRFPNRILASHPGKGRSMSDAANLIFSLAGSVCVAASLAAGDALRTNDEPFRRRLTARMLLALVFLAAALAGNTVELLRTQSGLSSGVGLCWLLLAGGTATALWTFAWGPRRRGDETLAERITPRGKLALGLLAVAQLIELASGRTTTMLQQVVHPGGAISLLAMLGLLLLALGTTAAVALFRSRSPVLPGTDSVVKRLSPLAKGTFILLTLALGLIALACFLSPDLGRLLSLVLLTLGITTGLMTLFFTSKFDLRNEPGRWGISPRGWVSLTLLAMAGIVLGAQEGRLLGIADRRWGRELDSSRAAVPEPVGRVVDPPSLWSLRTNYAPAPIDTTSERKRLEHKVADLQQRYTALENALRTGQPPIQPAPPPQPSSEQARLLRELAAIEKQLDDLKAAIKSSQPQTSSAPPPTGDRARSVEMPPSGYPVVDLSKGFPR